MEPRPLLQICSGLAAVTALLLGAILATHGFPARFDARALQIDALESESRVFSAPKAHCFLTPEDSFRNYDAAKCLAPIPGKRNWLLFGDSHAAMLYGGLTKALPELGILPAVTFACDLDLNAQADGRACHDLTARVFRDYLPRAKLEGVILTSRWESIDAASLIRLAHDLAARKQRLVIIGPAPEFSVPVARILAEAERRHDPSLPRRSLEPKLWAVDTQLAQIARTAGFTYLSPMRAMCATADRCILADPAGVPLYSDGTHYTDTGAGMLIDRLRATDAAQGYPFRQSLGERGRR